MSDVMKGTPGRRQNQYIPHDRNKLRFKLLRLVKVRNEGEARKFKSLGSSG